MATERVARIAGATAVLAAAWCLLLVATGGFDITLSGVTITTHDVTRPAVAGVIALAVFVWARGPRALANGIASRAGAVDRRLAALTIPDRPGAWMIAAAVAISASPSAPASAAAPIRTAT